MNFLALHRHKGRMLTALVATLFLMSFVLIGCGNSGSGGAGTEQQKTQDGSADATSSEGQETRLIKHAMGETPVPANPKRVVVLTNEGTEALLALGIKPVGAVQSWTGNPWYEHIKEQMEGVTPVGLESQVNLEAIAALEPDLIIGNKMRQEKIYPQLSAIAPTVFSDTLRGEWQTNFKLYAEAVNKVQEGEKVLADFERRITEFREKAGDKLSTKVSVVRFMAGKTRLLQKDTFSGVILDQIGFARPDSQNVDAFAEEITKERIPEMDGDILFYFTYETGDGEGTKQEKEWLNDPLFKNLKVVKAGNVHKVDDVIWNTAGGVIAANLFLDDLEKYFLDNK
ncbi:MAG: hypothetical protein BAA01_03765 [Bacillus thermozeamaize]|uniref:Fe/B12 periplasmic-binding domain-containing protein n=1 Tax=Bacillus thermozeamaize TaxID=230954 RepID=A0A1Y3PH87_9BACI|nr:MAG: hypothetical protein BAA01_03765 [Bacillus thermozeamaize]